MQKRKINLLPRARYRVPLSESSALSRHPVFVRAPPVYLFLRPLALRPFDSPPFPLSSTSLTALALDPAPREAAATLAQPSRLES